MSGDYSREEIEELVDAAKTNLQKFTEIYQIFLPLIYSFIYNRVGNSKEIAQDITSQVFETIVINLPKYKQQKNASFKAYVYRIANNKIIDYYRKHKSINISDSEFSQEPSGELDSISSAISQEEQLVIKASLLELKPRYQEAISLRYYSELELEEIAEVMQTGTRNVSVILHRALEALEKKLKHKLT